MIATEQQGMHPLLSVTLMVGVALGLVTLNNNLSLWVPPIALAASAVGLVAVVVVHKREVRVEQGLATVVDYSLLAAKDMQPFRRWLKENVRGHDAVVESVVAELERNLRLSKAGRHLGAFLLVGPTGTGKTFLAQLVGEALYTSSKPVVLRMNQYKHPQDVFSLIGPPPGMPGYEVGGALTRPVLENPYRVVIFDEIEKAHRDLHHCLYDILDAASCREKSSGRLVDFSGAVFFATCNAGVEALRQVQQQTRDTAAWLGRSRDVLADAGGFDKAFLARWNGIYLMDELEPVAVAEVACLQLAKYWREYGMEVSYTAPEIILDTVTRNQEFREYGVRQLATFIQTVTNDAILQARARGRVRVRLEIGKDARLTVQDSA